MSTFFCLYNSVRSDSKNLPLRVEQLAEACRTLKVGFHALDESEIDQNQLPEPAPRDAIYNCARGTLVLEQLLLRKGLRTAYRQIPNPVVGQDNHLWSILLEQNDVDSPSTVWIGSNHRELLRSYVDSLGGFPIVLKVFGGSCGVGVMKVTDWHSLFSVCDFLTDRAVQFCLRRYIPSATCDRHVVLGNEVIASMSRPIAADDFRSDGDPSCQIPCVPTKEIADLAVKAAHTANFNFAGIDILTDRTNGKAYVLEVNCPMDWIAMQKSCQVKIAERFVRWLFED